jgi:hypothetical protein
MKASAEAAHEPVREGRFHDRATHERDRRAKWGGAAAPSRRRPTNRLQRRGLIPHTHYSIVRASSESTANGKLARNAIDGDPQTHWHTRFGDDLAKPPHQLLIDLGAVRTIRGFRYLARQDAGWNGTVGRCEFYVSADREDFGQPVCSARFEKTKQSQQVDCPPQRGRYVLVQMLAEVNGGPWASAAEIGVIGE